MTVIDITIFILYLVGIVLFGSFFYRKNKTASAFTLGNNTLPSWVITLSILATFVSSISYLALPGQVFLTDWNPFVFSLSLPLASIVFGTAAIFIVGFLLGNVANKLLKKINENSICIYSYNLYDGFSM